MTKFLIDNYLNDKGNMNPVVSCLIVPSGNYAELEMSSVEETNRLIKVENIKIFGQNCTISRIGEGSVYGNT